jgi:hypothetical protein
MQKHGRTFRARDARGKVHTIQEFIESGATGRFAGESRTAAAEYMASTGEAFRIADGVFRLASGMRVKVDDRVGL